MDAQRNEVEVRGKELDAQSNVVEIRGNAVESSGNEVEIRSKDMDGSVKILMPGGRMLKSETPFFVLRFPRKKTT